MEKSKHIKEWTDVWKGPFYTDGMGYIYSSNDVTTFTVSMDMDPENPYIISLVNDILTVLNGGEINRKYSNLTVKDCDIYYMGTVVGYFRGWGYLISPGGLNLPHSQAEKLQDGLAQFVMEKLKK